MKYEIKTMSNEIKSVFFYARLEVCGVLFCNTNTLFYNSFKLNAISSLLPGLIDVK